MPEIVNSIQLQRQPGTAYVLSYGAGVDSTAMFLLIQEKSLPLDHIVFADTGDERKETYAYIQYIKSVFESKGIPFHIVKTRSGRSLLERCLLRHVIPSKFWRWCTRDMKIRPIYAFYKSLQMPVIQYVGFDAKEKKRIDKMKARFGKLGDDAPAVDSAFPLFDFGIDREASEKRIQLAGLLVPIKSSCFFCPYASTEQWVYLYHHHRDQFYEAIRMEESNKHFPKQRLFKIPLRELEYRIVNKLPLPKSRASDNCGSL